MCLLRVPTHSLLSLPKNLLSTPRPGQRVRESALFILHLRLWTPLCPVEDSRYPQNAFSIPLTPWGWFLESVSVSRRVFILLRTTVAGDWDTPTRAPPELPLPLPLW